MNGPTSSLSFAGLCLLLSVSPGPDSLLVLRLALNRRRDGVAVAAGSALGSMVWAAVVAVGFARLLSGHPNLVTALHIVGGAYLVYLGAREMLDTGELVSAAMGRRAKLDPRSFGKGLLSCLLNPKVGLFFLVVAPQYAPSLSVASILALGVIDAVVAFMYLTALAVTANLIFERITDSRAQRRLRLCSGASIALVGVYVFVDAVM